MDRLVAEAETESMNQAEEGTEKEVRTTGRGRGCH